MYACICMYAVILVQLIERHRPMFAYTWCRALPARLIHRYIHTVTLLILDMLIFMNPSKIAPFSHPPTFQHYSISIFMIPFDYLHIAFSF